MATSTATAPPTVSGCRLCGANNHGIILPYADQTQATRDIIGAAYGSAGERCMALPVKHGKLDSVRKEAVPVEALTPGHIDYNGMGAPRAAGQRPC